jgi:Flp pilus assembly protein TadB
MNQLLIIVAALATGAAAYFLLMTVLLRRMYKKGMTFTERSIAETAERERRDGRRSLLERLDTFLYQRGYGVEPLPVLVIGGLVYLIIAGVVRGFGLPLAASIIIGAPAAAFVGLGIVRVADTRRRRAFNAQLVSALSLVASQLESGNSPARAFEIVTPSLSQPLRGEFQRVLQAAEVEDFADAVGRLKERYPSRSVDLLVAALRFNKRTGGSLAPIIREAAGVMQRELELGQEATAEIAQVRGEFFGIIGIIVLIMISLLSGADEEFRKQLLSPFGVITLVVFSANFLWGIKRALNKFSQARGDR